MYNFIEDNIKRVTEHLAEAARRAGRSPEEVTLVSVSKTHPAEALRAAVEFGAADLGESRIQEAERKIRELGPIAKWHMIGHLQRNKARNAVELFDMIQSLDSIRLAEELENRAESLDKRIECLIELNSSGEESKYGFAPERIIEAIDRIKSFRFVKLRGIMTIGPNVDEENEIRKAFRLTRDLHDKGRKIIGPSFDILSFGMSGDYEIAIEEGSNMVRVGTAIFGPRRK